MTWINLHEGVADLFAEADASIAMKDRSEPDTFLAFGTRTRAVSLPDPRRCEHVRCGKVFVPKADRGRFCCPEHRRHALAMKRRRETKDYGWFRRDRRRAA